MSFSHDVKEELCSLMTDKNKSFACLYGILLCARHFNENTIIFQTEHEGVATLFTRLIDSFARHKKSYSIDKANRKNGTTLTTIAITDTDTLTHFANTFHRNDEKERRLCYDLLSNNNMFAFVSGVFLACGSVTEPIKDYHLELDIPHHDLCEDIFALISTIGINVKKTVRKNVDIIYLKGSEDIEDMLTLMGATKASIEIMNVKIYKDVRNKANRIANCDNANIERTLAASEKQIEDIEFIISKKGIEYLPFDLREIALIRLENPDVSLRELGEMLDTPISRSGANHRLKRITAIAEKLKCGGQSAV